MEKRKVFDVKSMRVDGIDPEIKKFVKAAEKKERMDKKKGGGGAASKSGGAMSKKEKWKADSEAFRAAMRAGKEVSKAMATGGPLPENIPSALPSDFIHCPHCGRSFNQKAGERHIPQCQNIKAKPSSLKRGVGSNASSKAKPNVSSRGFGRF